MEFWAIFLTGLTVGGFTCAAVQGGLLASVVAKDESSNHLIPTLAFLASKLVAYTALGALLGLFGSALALSDTTRIIMQLMAGGYMVLIALNLLGLVPAKLVSFQPPRFLTNLVKDELRKKSIFTPALLGLMTIFIPCGTTLAMETLAISTGNPILGAATLGIFVLGTTPLFLGIGYLTSRVKSGLSSTILKLAAIFILYLGLSSVNGALNLAGYQIPIEINLSGERSVATNVAVVNGVQTANITVMPTSYTPNRIQVQSKVPVQLNLMSKGGYGCTSEFRIPSLGISKSIPYNGSATVAFTPKSPGKISWTCSMGMYNGIIEVI